MRVECFYGRDGTKLNRHKPNRSTKHFNYKTKNRAWLMWQKTLKPKSMRSTFFTGPMVEHIVFCTNILEIDRIKSNFCQSKRCSSYKRMGSKRFTWLSAHDFIVIIAFYTIGFTIKIIINHCNALQVLLL